MLSQIVETVCLLSYNYISYGICDSRIRLSNNDLILYLLYYVQTDMYVRINKSNEGKDR